MRKFKITVDGQPYVVEVEEVAASETVEIVKTEPVKVAAPSPQPKPEAKPQPSANVANSGIKLVAPMPGTILDLKFKDGDSVKKGDVVVILEAMKMENEIVATDDGVIKYAVSKGASVQTGDTIATL